MIRVSLGMHVLHALTSMSRALLRNECMRYIMLEMRGLIFKIVWRIVLHFDDTKWFLRVNEGIYDLGNVSYF